MDHYVSTFSRCFRGNHVDFLYEIIINNSHHLQFCWTYENGSKPYLFTIKNRDGYINIQGDQAFGHAFDPNSFTIFSSICSSGTNTSSSTLVSSPGADVVSRSLKIDSTWFNRLQEFDVWIPTQFWRKTTCLSKKNTNNDGIHWIHFCHWNQKSKNQLLPNVHSQSSKGKSRCNLNSKTSRAASHNSQSPGSPGPCFWMPFSKPTKGENIRWWAGDYILRYGQLLSYLSSLM